jgi:microcystin-dependent protein
MSAPFIGQIAIFGFQFAPRGWEFCQGQMMAIYQNVPLFEILQTTYGGNGQSTFALPNLQGIPVGAGQGPGRGNYTLGQAGGEATVTLTPQQMPSHSHAFNAVTNQATSASPQGHQLAKAWKAQAKTDSVASFYSDNPGNAKAALAPNAIGPSGSGHPHNNMQPYLTLNFCIALQGVTPSPNGTPAAVRQPFLGEISICAFGNPPPGWALCEGQMLPVISHEALYSLIFTAYGGDGMRQFGLPDLRGRVPLNLVAGPNSSLGSRGGEETHALTAAEMPVHSHALMADATSTSVGNTPSPGTVPGMSLGKEMPGNTPFTADLYSTAAADAKLAGSSLGNSGGGQRHSNMMPSLALSFCINVDSQSPYPERP